MHLNTQFFLVAIALGPPAEENGKTVRLVQIEDFFHHGKTLARLEVGDRLEEDGHFLLPSEIRLILIQDTPGSVKISDLHNQNQILIPAEDRILGDAHFLELGEQGGPDVAMGLFVLLLLAGSNPQSKRNARHVDPPIRLMRKRPVSATRQRRKKIISPKGRESRRVFAIVGSERLQGPELKSKSSNEWATFGGRIDLRQRERSDVWRVGRLHGIHPIVTGRLPMPAARLPQ